MPTPAMGQIIAGDARQKQAHAGTVWALLTALFAASILLPPPGAGGRIAGLPSVCLFYHLTGLPCPGCGLTRSFVCLGHGQVLEALHWHPLGPALFLFCGLLWLRGTIYLMRGITLVPLPPRTVSRLSLAGGLLLIFTDLARIGWLSAHHLRF